MGLEGADDALIGHGTGGGEQRVELTGMMGIVVKHCSAVIAALVFKPPSGSVEGTQAFLHGLSAETQHIGR